MAASWVANCAREIKLVLRLLLNVHRLGRKRRFGNGLHIVVPGTPAELTTADFRQGPGSWSSAAGQSSKQTMAARGGAAVPPPRHPYYRGSSHRNQLHRC